MQCDAMGQKNLIFEDRKQKEHTRMIREGETDDHAESGRECDITQQKNIKLKM